MLNPGITTDGLVSTLSRVCKSKGYWFPDGTKAYDIFLFGVRNVKNADTWNDALGCVWKNTATGAFQLHVWLGTTDPGRPALIAPTNPAGTAVLAPGQHRAAWVQGSHRGRPALVQNRALPVLRDTDRDLDIDPIGTPTAGFYGINLHDAYRDDLAAVGEASEGCMVWHNHADHAEMLRLAQMQRTTNGWATFSFTLFDVREDPLLGAFLALI